MPNRGQRRNPYTQWLGGFARSLSRCPHNEENARYERSVYGKGNDTWIDSGRTHKMATILVALVIDCRVGCRCPPALYFGGAAQQPSGSSLGAEYAELVQAAGSPAMYRVTWRSMPLFG